jgi:hypothetical protein
MKLGIYVELINWIALVEYNDHPGFINQYI